MKDGLRKDDFLKPLVRSLYDVQKVRIMVGNRLFAAGVLKWVKEEGRKTPKLVYDYSGLDKVGDITAKALRNLANHHQEFLKREGSLLLDVGGTTKPYDIHAWLERQKGVGPSVIGCILSEIGGVHYPPWAQTNDERKKRGTVDVEMYKKSAANFALKLKAEGIESFVVDGLVKAAGKKALKTAAAKVDAAAAKAAAKAADEDEDEDAAGEGGSDDADDRYDDEEKGKKVAVQIVPVYGIEAFYTTSAMWAYCGIDTDKGLARRKKRGEPAAWNHFLKCKLLGVLGPSFLKSESPWSKIYYDYKSRIEHRESLKPKAERLNNGDPKRMVGHIHRMAIRYMVKMFLAALYEEWSKILGLPYRGLYAEEFLGRKHRRPWRGI